MKKITTTLLCASFLAANAQSPTDLTKNVGKTANDWINVTDNAGIEKTFNEARRFEENNLGLTPNSIKNLSLPANWKNLSDDDRALYLLNDERTCRKGIDYGSGPVKGLPYQGLESKVDKVAQNHAADLVSINKFQHDGSDKSSPYDRIKKAIGEDCRDFNSYAENLSLSSYIGSPHMLVEQAVYGWIYEDAISKWGHRRACLMQDKDPYPNTTGFVNNYGDANSEGFLGIGVIYSASYNPSNWNNVDGCGLVVMNFFDPSGKAGCDYGESTADIASNEKDNFVQLYPNPVSDVLNMEFSDLAPSINIYDNMGQLVLQHEGNSYLVNINVSQLQSGVYFARMHNGSNKPIKFIKQ